MHNDCCSFSADLLLTWLFSILHLYFLILFSLLHLLSFTEIYLVDFYITNFLKIILYANLVSKIFCFSNSVLLEPIF